MQAVPETTPLPDAPACSPTGDAWWVVQLVDHRIPCGERSLCVRAAAAQLVAGAHTHLN